MHSLSKIDTDDATSDVVVDRIAPTARPNRAVSGYQSWRSLLFLHWAVPAESLRRVIPDQLSVDEFDGTAYVGVVPFVMRGIRPTWWPKPWALNFLETNVRTYVHCNGQPGVYFLSLDADSRLAVWGARVGWGLPYHFANKSFQRETSEIEFTTSRRQSLVGLSVRYRIGEPIGPSKPNSLEHFLLERYILFVERRGNIYAGQVHHEPYPAQFAEVLELRENLIDAAGLPMSSKLPIHAHYAEGVDVDIFGLQPVTRQR